MQIVLERGMDGCKRCKGEQLSKYKRRKERSCDNKEGKKAIITKEKV